MFTNNSIQHPELNNRAIWGNTFLRGGGGGGGGGERYDTIIFPGHYKYFMITN